MSAICVIEFIHVIDTIPFVGSVRVTDVVPLVGFVRAANLLSTSIFRIVGDYVNSLCTAIGMYSIEKVITFLISVFFLNESILGKIYQLSFMQRVELSLMAFEAFPECRFFRKIIFECTLEKSL